MKRLFLLIFILALALPAQAQEATKYWIFLKDKQNSAGKVAKAAPDYLTNESLSRRSIRATRTPVERDAPVSDLYVKALEKEGIAPIVQSRWFNAISAYLTQDDLEKIQSMSFVKAIQPVGKLNPLQEPAHLPLIMALPGVDIRQQLQLDYGPSLTQLQVVNAVPILEEGLNATGVKLGIIDTGMGSQTANHPATAAMVTENRFTSMDFTNQPADASRHGHQVLTVAAGFHEGNLIGPAYGAEIYHARTEYTPTETNQEEDNFVAGIEWMEAQGVDVVNISLGYTDFDPGQNSYTIADLDGDTGITTRAADMAAEMGVVVVTSAGNSGCSSPNNCWYYISTPADADSVITAGGVTSSSVLWTSSSRGPTADNRTKPDVSAQSQSVYFASSSSNGYTSGNGTSFSSPMIAGVAAVMLQVNPHLTPLEVRGILRETASHATEPNNNIGWGIIDAERAIAEARNLLPTNTESELPQSITLDAPYPNPFVDFTSLVVANQGTPVVAKLTVYNTLGQEVLTALNDWIPAGQHRVDIDLSGQSAGLYFYRFEAGNVKKTGSFVRL